MQQVLFDEADDSSRRILRADAQRLGQDPLYRLVSLVEVERNGASGIGAGAQPAEHQLRVRHRRLRAARPIGGWTWHRTGALRTREHQSGAVDPCDGAAAGADRMDVDGGEGEVVSGDLELVGNRDLSAAHEHRVAARAPDLHGDQIVGADRATVPSEGTDARGRA